MYFKFQIPDSPPWPPTIRQAILWGIVVLIVSISMTCHPREKSALPLADKRTVVQKAVAQQVIIKVKPDVTPEQIEILRGEMKATEVTVLGGINARLWKIDGDIDALIATYRSDPRLVYIEPNYIVEINTPTATPLVP